MTLLVIFPFGKALSFNEGTQSLTLDGVLYRKGTTTPLADSNIQLKVQVINPAGTCVLYEESQSVSTLNTKGFFNIQVGSAVGSGKRTGNDPGRTMAQVFQNTVSIAASDLTSASCSGGAYIPAAGDVRYFRITVTPSTTSVADVLTPDILMDSVPQAIVAQSLQGLERANILAVNTAGGVSLNQTNLESLFTGTAYTNLQSILSGNFLRTDSSGATLPSYASTPAGVSIGDMWYDSASNEVKYQSNSGTQTLGAVGVVSGSSITSGTISGNTAINTTGNLATTGVITGATVTGSTVQATNLRVYNGAQYVQFTAQPMSGNYSLALPTADGVSGQVMATNGAGILSWITPSSSAGTISVGQGGTNATSFAANRMIASNGTGSALQAVSCSLNQVISFDVTGNYGCYNLSAIAGSQFIANGGNSTGAAISLGTNDNQPLQIKTNNTVAMTISQNGFIGIGTISPGSKLTVQGNGTSAFDLAEFKQSGDAILRIGSTDGSRPAITLESSGNQDYSIIGQGTGVYRYLGFHTSGNLNSAPAMAIKHDGNISIGHANPSSILDLSGALTAQGLSTAPSVSPVNTGRIFFDYATNKFRVSENGGAYTDLVGTGGSVSGAFMDGGNTTTGTALLGTNSNQALQLETNGTVAMTISQDGSVGIGTPSPSSLLHVSKSQASPTEISIENRNTIAATGSADIVFKGYRDVQADYPLARIRLQPSASASVGNLASNGNLLFMTGGYDSTLLPIERMRIDHWGNIGIGTDSPSSALDVSGSFTAQGLSTAPSVSPSRTGRIFFDYATNKFRVSENGGAFVDLVGTGGGGFTGSGTSAAIPRFTSASTLGDSGLSDNGTLISSVRSISVASNQNYQINGQRVLAVLNNNSLAVGPGANSIFSTGYNSTAIGQSALNNNSSGNDNTAIGYLAGSAVLSGSHRNTIIGSNALSGNTTGGYDNVAVGHYAGPNEGTSPVSYSMFLGSEAGWNSEGGNYNSFIGYRTGTTTPGTSLTNATAVGAFARVNANNSLVLGSNGVNVGIAEVTSPTSKLDFQGALTSRGVSSGSAGLSDLSTGRIYFDSTANKFRVSENGGAYVDLVSTGGSVSGAFTDGGNTTTGTAILGTNSSHALGFETNGATAMTISQNGNVGVGTTSPNAQLDVVGQSGQAGSPNGRAGVNVVGGSGFSTGNGNGGGIALSGGAGTGSGQGGGVTIEAGDTPNTGPAATTIIRGGTFSSSGASFVELRGSGSLTTGGVTLSSGTPTGIVGGTGGVSIQTPTAAPGQNLAQAGPIDITAGNGSAGALSSPGGAITITAGSGGTGNATAGSSVAINPGAGGGGGLDGVIALANLRGNVGIGTSTPVNKLHVADSSGSDARLLVDSTSANAEVLLRPWSAGVGATREWRLQALATSKVFALHDYDSNTRPFQVYGGSGNDSALIVGSTGNVGVGTSSPEAKLDVTDTGTTTSAIIVPRAANFTGTTVNGMIRYNTTSTLFEFRQNGAWVNYTTVSDARLKTNVQPVTQGLELVNQLNPVFYDWDRSNPKATSFEDKHQVGFIAQEVEKVLPEVVNQGEDSYRSLEYGKMVAVAIAAIKELYLKLIGMQSEVDAALAAKDAEIQELKKENLEMKARLEKIEEQLQIK